MGILDGLLIAELKDKVRANAKSISESSRSLAGDVSQYDKLMNSFVQAEKTMADPSARKAKPANLKRSYQNVASEQTPAILKWLKNYAWDENGMEAILARISGADSITQYRQSTPGTLESAMAQVDKANPNLTPAQRDAIKYRIQRLASKGESVGSAMGAVTDEDIGAALSGQMNTASEIGARPLAQAFDPMGVQNGLMWLFSQITGSPARNNVPELSAAVQGAPGAYDDAMRKFAITPDSPIGWLAGAKNLLADLSMIPASVAIPAMSPPNPTVNDSTDPGAALGAGVLSGALSNVSPGGLVGLLQMMMQGQNWIDRKVSGVGAPAENPDPTGFAKQMVYGNQPDELQKLLAASQFAGGFLDVAGAVNALARKPISKKGVKPPPPDVTAAAAVTPDIPEGPLRAATTGTSPVVDGPSGLDYPTVEAMFKNMEAANATVQGRPSKFTAKDRAFLKTLVGSSEDYASTMIESHLQLRDSGKPKTKAAPKKAPEPEAQAAPPVSFELPEIKSQPEPPAEPFKPATPQEVMDMTDVQSAEYEAKRQAAKAAEAPTPVVAQPPAAVKAAPPETPAAPKPKKPKAEKAEDTTAPPAKTESVVRRPVYHGTNKEFDEFADVGETGGAHTGASTARLGHFFTEDPVVGAAYAAGLSATDALARGTRGDPARVIRARITLTNPLDFTRLSKAQVRDLDSAFPGFADKFYGSGDDKFDVFSWLAKQDADAPVYDPENFVTWANKRGITDKGEISRLWEGGQSDEFKAWRAEQDAAYQQTRPPAKAARVRAKLQSMGYDGVIVNTAMDSATGGSGKSRQFVVFDPTQIVNEGDIPFETALGGKGAAKAAPVIQAAPSETPAAPKPKKPKAEKVVDVAEDPVGVLEAAKARLAEAKAAAAAPDKSYAMNTIGPILAHELANAKAGRPVDLGIVEMIDNFTKRVTGGGGTRKNAVNRGPLSGKGNKQTGAFDRKAMSAAALAITSIAAAPAAVKLGADLVASLGNEDEADGRRQNAEAILASIAAGAAVLGGGRRIYGAVINKYPHLAFPSTGLMEKMEEAANSMLAKGLRSPYATVERAGFKNIAQAAHAARLKAQSVANKLDLDIRQATDNLPVQQRAESFGPMKMTEANDPNALKTIFEDMNKKSLFNKAKGKGVKLEEAKAIQLFGEKYNEVAEVAWQAGNGPVLKVSGISKSAVRNVKGLEGAVHDLETGRMVDKGKIVDYGYFDEEGNKVGMGKGGSAGWVIEYQGERNLYHEKDFMITRKSQSVDGWYRVMRDDLLEQIGDRKGVLFEKLKDHFQEEFGLSPQAAEEALRNVESREWDHRHKNNFDGFIYHERSKYKLPDWAYDWSMSTAIDVLKRSSAGAKFAQELGGIPHLEITAKLKAAGYNEADALEMVKQIKSIISPYRGDWSKNAFTVNAVLTEATKATYVATMLNSTIGALQWSQAAPGVAVLGARAGGLGLIDMAKGGAAVRAGFEEAVKGFRKTPENASLWERAKASAHNVGLVVENTIGPRRMFGGGDLGKDVEIGGVIDIDNFKHVLLGETVGSTLPGTGTSKFTQALKAGNEAAVKTTTAVNLSSAVDRTLRVWAARSSVANVKMILGKAAELKPEGYKWHRSEIAGTLTPDLYRHLSRWYKLSDREIADLLNNGVPDTVDSSLGGSAALNKIYSFGSETQGVTQSWNVPRWVSSTPWGRTATQFLNFAYATSNVYGLSLIEARHGNYKPIAKLLAGMYVTGAVVDYVATGRDYEEPNWLEQAYTKATGSRFRGTFGMAGDLLNLAARAIESMTGQEEGALGRSEDRPKDYTPEPESGAAIEFFEKLMDNQALGYFGMFGKGGDEARDYSHRNLPPVLRNLNRGLALKEKIGQIATEEAPYVLEEDDKVGAASYAVRKALHESLMEFSPEYKKQFLAGLNPLVISKE